MLRRTLAGFVALIAAAGCASTQTVQIECVPREVAVYVDGRKIEGREAELSTDRAHKIFAKGDGYEPRLVVVEPEVGDDGRAGFRDDSLCLQLVPMEMKRKLEVEVEPGVESAPPPR